MSERKRCFACERPEPKSGRDMDDREWMESPSGNVYCPSCFDVFFVEGRLPEILEAKAKA